MKDKFFLILGIVVISWSFYAFLQKPTPAKYQANSLQLTAGSVLKIGDKQIKIEIADTNGKRTQGLSGRESLTPGTGLLFVFEEPGNYGFWMKDMKFALDIVWLDENYEVIGVEKNVSPGTYPQVFYPPRPAKYVLELNAGESGMLELNQ